MIELLMVLAIIGVIVAFAVPIFSYFSDSSKVDELKSKMFLLAGAQEKYFIKNATYAPSLQSLGGANTFGISADDGMDFATGVYIKKGGEMFYWIYGKRCINNTPHCWLYIPSLVSKQTTDVTNFIELKSGVKVAYDIPNNCVCE